MNNIKNLLSVTLISFALLFLFTCEVRAVRSMRHFTVNDGLSTNAVYSITQDSKGIMWFGTIDGLHSFDGGKIRSWRDESVSSLGPNIFSILEYDTKIYVGSDQGLSVLDLLTESFSTFDVRTKSGEGVRSSVSAIKRVKNGNIWIGTTEQGAFCYSPTTGEFRQYPALSKIGSDWIVDILEDGSGRILAATWNKGIWIYNPDDDNFEPYISAADVALRTIYEDRHGNLWVGTWSEGLFLVNKENLNLENKVKPKSVNKPLQVRGIVEWEEGYLLFASDEGLTVYDMDKETHETITIGEGNINLNDNYLHSLFVDKEKGLWIGSYFGGVNYIPYKKDYFRHYKPYKKGLDARIVSVMAKADDGNLWLGTDDAGVFYWDRKKDEFKSYTHFSNGRQTSYHNIHAILQDGDKLFVGMYMGGLDILDLKTGKMRNYRHGSSERSLYSSDVYAIYKDSEGNILIGTTGGLNRYDEETDDFERIYEISMLNVSSITEDLDDNLWICSCMHGVCKYNRKAAKWEHFFHKIRNRTGSLPVNNIITACVDRYGDIWLGSDGAGLIKYDSRTDTLLVIDLPEHIRVVNKIVADKNSIWFTTSNGLFCYDSIDKTLKAYNENDGLQDDMFMPNSGVSLDNGNICFGGINGFNVFNPSEIPDKKNQPNVILTDFYLFNKPLDISSEGSPLKTSITYADKLVLTYEQTVFGFSVVVPSYSNPEGNLYRYKLDGFDDDWIESSHPPKVAYTNLPSRKYKFRVSVANSDGIWFEDVISFPIEVLPPWWLSVYMIILYVICSLVLLSYLFYRLNRKHKRSIISLTLQKDREIYQSKIEFFTHIMHEIRTPLTLIIAPLENVMKSGGTITDAMPQLKIIEKNGKRLLNLVNQLMDFRKVESGSMNLRMRPSNLKLLTESVYQRFQPLAGIKGITISTNITECCASVDSEAYVKVMSNLLTNALKYTSTHIWLNVYTDPENLVRLEVKDDGNGIMPSDREKIFQPFYQCNSGYEKADNVGTGVGLSLVKKLVEQMDGRLELKSEPGKGALFTVIFKAVAPTCVDNAPDVYPNDIINVPDVPTGVEANSKYKILIVDDNSDIIEYLTTILSSLYDVDCALNGVEAWGLLEKNAYDLVISDVMMPVMDGMELCRRIKSHIATSHIPVVLLTAKATKDDYVEGLENGADVYLEKPFSEDILKAQIKSLFLNREKARKDFVAKPNTTLSESVSSKVDLEFLGKISEIIDRHIVDPDFSVDVLAHEVGISRSGLFVKIKAVAGMTPNDYVRLVRLKTAARLLKDERISSSEACYRVGFSSPSYFSQCFYKQFGVSPKDYRN